MIHAGYSVRTLTNSPNRENPFHCHTTAYPYNFDDPQKMVNLFEVLRFYITIIGSRLKEVASKVKKRELYRKKTTQYKAFDYFYHTRLCCGRTQRKRYREDARAEYARNVEEIFKAVGRNVTRDASIMYCPTTAQRGKARG